MSDLASLELWSSAVALCALALFAGATVKGVVGLGLPLIAVPFMTLIVSLPTAVAILTLPIIIANIWQGLQTGLALPIIRRFWPAALALTAGIWGGVRLMIALDPRVLSVVLGLAVILSVLTTWFRPSVRIPERSERPVGIVIGLIAGVLGGTSTFFGPPLFVYLVGLKLDKEEFITAIAFLYLCGGLPLALALLVFGVMGIHELTLSALALIPVSAGMLLGQRIRAAINARLFLNVTLVVMLITGIGLIYKAL
jgi:hypothetical protein